MCQGLCGIATNSQLVCCEFEHAGKLILDCIEYSCSMNYGNCPWRFLYGAPITSSVDNQARARCLGWTVPGKRERSDCDRKDKTALKKYNIGASLYRHNYLPTSEGWRRSFHLLRTRFQLLFCRSRHYTLSATSKPPLGALKIVENILVNATAATSPQL